MSAQDALPLPDQKAISDSSSPRTPEHKTRAIEHQTPFTKHSKGSKGHPFLVLFVSLMREHVMPTQEETKKEQAKSVTKDDSDDDEDDDHYSQGGSSVIEYEKRIRKKNYDYILSLATEINTLYTLISQIVGLLQDLESHRQERSKIIFDVFRDNFDDSISDEKIAEQYYLFLFFLNKHLDNIKLALSNVAIKDERTGLLLTSNSYMASRPSQQDIGLCLSVIIQSAPYFLQLCKTDNKGVLEEKKACFTDDSEIEGFSIPEKYKGNIDHDYKLIADAFGEENKKREERRKREEKILREAKRRKPTTKTVTRWSTLSRWQKAGVVLLGTVAVALLATGVLTLLGVFKIAALATLLHTPVVVPKLMDGAGTLATFGATSAVASHVRQSIAVPAAGMSA